MGIFKGVDGAFVTVAEATVEIGSGTPYSVLRTRSRRTQAGSHGPPVIASWAVFSDRIAQTVCDLPVH
jgi:hypothetical protein